MSNVERRDQATSAEASPAIDLANSSAFSTMSVSICQSPQFGGSEKMSHSLG